MGYYRMYQQRHTPVERVTGNNIPARLEALIENTEVPQNTKGFLQSLADAFEKYEGLTGRQYEAFEKVENRHSAVETAARKAWVGAYTEEKRDVAKICAGYYIQTPYFRDLSQKILNDSAFVPTERQWRKMCENNYAKKVLAATYAEPKFAKGAMVKGRATANRAIRDKHVVIIEVNAAPVSRAAKGTKIYSVLPIGSPTTLLVEERELKKK
tara:strand:+ start:2302 stop:2937 length:636 start_codon:yes stop_codon:yes gene_type:complete